MGDGSCIGGAMGMIGRAKGVWGSGSRLASFQQVWQLPKKASEHASYLMRLLVG